jgi:DNA-directed RNA polymerase specialized sigma24 family protein
MIFHSVRGALTWYARAVQSDGVRSVWPSREALLVSYTPGSGRDQLDVFLTLWAIWRALNLLDVGAQRLLAWYYIEDLPVIDLAARWKRHPSRIYSRLQQASGVLAGRLREEGLLEEYVLRIDQEATCQQSQST